MARTISMMQPYLFPYLGYFQLIAASDAFVLGDDLQYVKRSWMNRNRILTQEQANLITFPLRRGGHLDAINERWLCDQFEQEAAQLIKVIERSYAKAPYRLDALDLLRSILGSSERNLARFAELSIRSLCAYMRIDTPIYVQSQLANTQDMDKQDRVIFLTQRLEGRRYLNLIGGISLYCPAYLASHDIELRFLSMNDLTYPQGKHAFVPSLSIIDVLMFNSRDEVKRLLECYTEIESPLLFESSASGQPQLSL
ncbi:WbqC-like protein [Pseudomonas duriflava]|uniref:WbqC-like protein n=1 Tax=Pseudomonas duriflava TaxID=459528 RepID=A0A562QIN7_9PSED|nr:WbqC family protein [Pseudomonas duriflava]TWI56599.1 WbqC-like protein [Pseudomonas duriflava]